MDKKNETKTREEKQCEQTMIIDSGATSLFVSEDLDLPKTGPSRINVFLPNDLKLQSSGKATLPFNQIVPEARDAEIIPGLR